jgi:hypothetical protein
MKKYNQEIPELDQVCYWEKYDVYVHSLTLRVKDKNFAVTIAISDKEFNQRKVARRKIKFTRSVRPRQKRGDLCHL